METEKNQIVFYQKQSFLNKDRVLSIVAIVLMVFLLVRSWKGQKEYEHTVVQRDTTINNIYKDTTFTTIPTVQYVIHDTIKTKEVQWLPSHNYDSLLAQFEYLKSKFLETAVVREELPIDTIGKMIITDSITENRIASRNVKSSIVIPEKTITITKQTTLPPKNIWLYGVSLQGNQKSLVNQFNLNLMLINKKRVGYQIGAGIGINGEINYTGGIYFKF